MGGVFVLGLAAFDLTLEAALILPAIPALVDYYATSLVAVAWLLTGFLLASVVAVPFFGRLGDLFGKRLMILVSLCAFAAGSLLCALTDSIGLAIAGRIVQGLGTAIAPLAYALARDIVAPELLPRVIGILVGSAGAAGAIGSLLSGVLVDHFSAPAIFWFLFALPLALVVGVLALVPESPVHTKVSVDVGGGVLLGLGLVLLLLAISKGNAWGWSSVRIVALFAASCASLTVFVLVERRVRQPLVELGLFVTRPFADANLCAFVFGYSFFLMVLVVPQIAATPTASGYGLGYSTTGIGLMLVPTGIAALVGGWAGGRVIDRIGPRGLLAAGSVLGIAAYFSLAIAHSTTLALTTGSAVVGLAAGLIPTGIYSVVVRSASKDKTTVAVAVNVVARITAVAIGAQVAFAIITGAGLAGPFPAEAGYSRVFLMGAAGAGLELLASALLPGRAATRH
jgi:MFS family permease